jgi:hypothetical protein
MTSERILTPQDFEPHVGQTMQAQWADGGGPLKLASMERLPPHAYREAPFVLHFAGDFQLSQGTCRITHPSLGVIDIFVVPVKGARGVEYEAVFN